MLPDKVKQKLRALPDQPGCYIMRDARGSIIYVGKAASLRKRVQSYFRDATARRGDPKVRSLVHSVADLDLIVTRTEAEAILTEGQLIKDYRPRYNVSFRDDKRFLLLRVNPADPLPEFKAVRFSRDDGARYFGPYASSAAARAALDFVEKRFGIRKCPPRVPTEEDHRHCINDIVRFCSAPCIGKVTAAEYHARVAEAGAFLEGERPELLKELREAMTAAAAAREFERAAALRDTLLLLQAVVRQRNRLGLTPELAASEGLAGVAELQRVLEADSPPRVIEAFDISNISGTHSVASMVCAVDGIPQRNRYRRFRIRTVEQSDDPAMMAEVIRRRYQRVLAEGAALPDLVLVDGGITQLQAARRELERLGLRQLAAAGLAKRFEELYRPGRSEPLLLPRDSRALRVLQRLRDEAHRFALTYHRQLRARRLRDSALDDVPGLGEKRKRALLERFGSLRRLMRASADEIAGVAGIGPGLSRSVLEHLGVVAPADGEP